MTSRYLSTTLTTLKSQVGELQNLRFVPYESSVYVKDDILRLSEFISSSRKLFVLTGAGISTESGIRDYRSEKVGLYAVSKDRPIQYQDFLNNPGRRHRYWARNFLGWPLFSRKSPNKGHLALAELERRGKVHWLVTQNVDGLHIKATSRRVTELHGTASRVQCLSCQAEVSRESLQQELKQVNEDLLVHSILQAPDGDVNISDSEITKFKMLPCPQCGGILKPKIVFFGEDISKQVKDFAHRRLEESDALLIVGSSLTVFSSYRIALMASKVNIPIAILNIGKTRGDHLASVHVNSVCGDVLHEISQKF